MKFIAHLLTEDGTLSVTIDASTYLVNKSHLNYNALMSAFKERDAEKFVKLYNVSTTVKNAFNGTGVNIVNDVIYFNGEVLHNSICDRIIKLLREGNDVQPLVNFLNKLMMNPSSNSVQQGFNFLSHKHLPICDDGDFLAYKTVRDNYMDKYSGTISNHIGAVIDWRHKRNQISDNPAEHCSHGLHVGALSYAGPGGWYNSVDDKVVIVKVNPMDMVSVPNDHSFTKMRVCRYEVIADYVAPLVDSVYNTQNPNEWNYEEDEDEDDYDVEEFFDDEVSLNDVGFGDRVEFDYLNRDGKTERRYIEIEECDDKILVGILLNGDPSYDRSSTSYRSFNTCYISNLKLILN